nr:CheR family methyltransferase [Paraburkholderia caffeinilytica]
MWAAGCSTYEEAYSLACCSASVNRGATSYRSFRYLQRTLTSRR